MVAELASSTVYGKSSSQAKETTADKKN
jgi:hypothetical protein